MKRIIVLAIVCLNLFAAISGYSQSVASKTTLYDDTTQFSTIEDVLKISSLQGKVVYIDMWGTRCGPCLEEFDYLASLKDRYKGKSVAFVYLKAPYGFDDSKEWKELITKHHLDGINISMSIQFYTHNFWMRYTNIYSKDRLFTIPTYLIVNKAGKVVDYDAPRPSDTQKLYALIDKEL